MKMTAHAKKSMALSPAGPECHRHSVGPPELAGPGGLADWGEASKHSALAPATGAETEIETRRRWAEWSSFALSSSSSVFCADASATSCGSDGGDEPPKRHPLEAAATERFLAADLRRRVLAAQTQMLPLMTAEKISLPGWMSWGRGSATHGGHEREVVCSMHNGDSPSVSTVADASPKRGRMSRAMRKLRKRLPGLHMAGAAFSFPAPALRLPKVSVPLFAAARSPDRGRA